MSEERSSAYEDYEVFLRRKSAADEEMAAFAAMVIECLKDPDDDSKADDLEVLNNAADILDHNASESSIKHEIEHVECHRTTDTSVDMMDSVAVEPNATISTENDWKQLFLSSFSEVHHVVYALITWHFIG